MIFVKVNNDFLTADEIAHFCNITIEEITECVDKGLLISYQIVSSYFPEYSNAVQKILALFELQNYSIDEKVKREIIDRAATANMESPQLLVREMLAEVSGGVSA